MASCPGRWLNCAACWGCPDVGRTSTLRTASLVRFAFIVEMEGREMKTPDTTKAVSSAPNSAKFTGTDNPRHLRAITVLIRRPVSRQELDSVAGASNSPELVAELRRRGLGRAVRPNPLSSTATGKTAARACIASAKPTAARFTSGRRGAGMAKRTKGDSGRDAGGFVALPWSVLDSPAYARLSHILRVLCFSSLPASSCETTTGSCCCLPPILPNEDGKAQT
jgi:hypothetical protein